MTDADAAVDTLGQAADLNRQDPLLVGSTLVLPDYGQVVMTGDLHGHRRNFEKLVRFCNLERAAVRHVIVQELIHEEGETVTDVDRSHRLLLAAARWKIDYPDQVHFLQSNHEFAQITGHDILKSGRSVLAAFEAGVKEDYGNENSQRVLDAIGQLVRSYPLAARTPNRVFLSHTLPDAQQIDEFDPAILDRSPTDADLDKHGPAHGLLWGRRHNEEILERLAKLLDADLFIAGHQPQETGYAVCHGRLLILASGHNHGVFLPFDLKMRYDLDALVAGIRPFAAVA